MIELYHGSNVIIDNPLVNIGRKELDFGPGFYITQIPEQAIGQLKFAKPTHQLCIRKQSLVDNYLHFEGFELIK